MHRSHTPVNAWVLAASSGGEDAYDGRFSIALAQVLEEVADTGLDTDPARSHVEFQLVAKQVAHRVARTPGMAQSVQSTAMVLAADEPALPFFPNGAFDPAEARLAEVDPVLRVFLGRQDKRHFVDKAGDQFVGRRSQLRALAPWLDDVEAGGLRVVTGNPGVGKSALLGALVCAAHPELQEVAPYMRARLSHDPQGCPSVAHQLAAVHARGRSADEVLTTIARQLRLGPAAEAGNATALVNLLPDTGEVPAVIVDALDEASEPDRTCTELVRLARAVRSDGQPVVRLTVGTRPWPQFSALLDLARAGDGLIDLDDADPDEVRGDLTAHLTGRLTAMNPYKPARMRAIRDRLAHAVADRLAPHPGEPAPWGAFLVAQIFTRYLKRVPAPDSAEAATALGHSAPTTLPQVLDLDLDTHPHGQQLRAILAAIALAQGQGMPLEIALPLAGLFTDLDPQHARRDLLPEVLFYLRTTPDHDGTLLYRLFHQALVDHLNPPTPDPTTPTPGDVLTHLLATHTTHDGTRRTWDTAPLYLLRHAPAHVQAAGRLDELLTDTEFLVHGAPDALLTAFPRAHTDQALLSRAVYRNSIGEHRNTDHATRRRLLALDAARYGAKTLTSALMDRAEAGTWTPVSATGGGLALACRDTLTQTAWVTAVACTVLDGRPLAVTGADDRTVRVWDLTTGRPMGEPLTGHTDWVNAVACTVVDGRPVAVTGGQDETVRVWDLITGCPVGEPLTGHTGGVRAVACTVVDGRAVAVTGDYDRTVRVWDLTTGRQIGKPFTGHTDRVNAVACTVLDGRPVAVTGSGDSIHRTEVNDTTVRVWDLTTGRQIGKPFTGHTDDVNAVACTVLDGRPVAVTGSEDHTVRVWDLATGRQIGEPLTGHTDRVHAVACTVLDGHPIAVTGDQDCTVRVWDLTTGQQVGEPLTGHTETVLTVACTVLDGRPVAVTGAHDAVRVWDLSTDRPVGEPLTGHTDWVNAVACTVLDGRPVAVTGSRDRTVRVWDLTTGHPIGEPLTGHTYGVSAVACTVLDGHPIAVTRSEDARRMWDLTTGHPIGAPPTGHTDTVYTVLEGRLVAVSVTTWEGSTTVRVWDLTTGRQIGEPLTARTHYPRRLGSAAHSVACTVLDGHPIAITGGGDYAVRVWDLATGRQIGAPPTGHTGTVYTVACTVLDGRPVAVTGGQDCTVRVWDLATGRQIGEPLTGHTDDVSAVACTVLDGRPVAVTGSYDHTVRVWDLTTGHPIGEPLIGHTYDVNAVACTVLDGHPIAVTGGQDCTMRVWDLTTGRPIGEPLTGHTHGVTVVACTVLDGSPVAVTGSEDAVRVWDLATGRQIGEPLTGHTEMVLTVACTVLDGSPVAVTGSYDHTVRVWDLTTGHPIGEPLTGHTHGVTVVTCTVLDGSPVAVTGSEDVVRVWDLATGRQIGEPLTGHTDWVKSVACTVLDGRPVAVTGSEDHTVRVWDLTTGHPIGEPPTGHTGDVSAVACTVLDGRPVAVTGSQDRTVRVWDLTTGHPIGEPLTGHTDRVNVVACTVLDGRPVAVTGSQDRTVRVWDLSTGECIDRIPLPAPCRALGMGTGDRLVVGLGPDVVFLTRALPRSVTRRTRGPDGTTTPEDS
ncbi:AAA family ATPase (plasmid) [Streptomyces sp. NBC_01591]|uniref:AAA family ATPase n=1 Tax=Streptomyces sp. NBC_01591 TaxID=2975888 RepID=UPI002DDC8425|nr:AAA family ATPase [Streptomyces sp. NBC_01591]WSD74764.1 AAA family ATPase [Streptomyces sp. NBC_01591]